MTYAQALAELQQRSFDALKVATNAQFASIEASRDIAWTLGRPSPFAAAFGSMTSATTEFTFALLAQQVAYAKELSQTFAAPRAPVAAAPVAPSASESGAIAALAAQPVPVEAHSTEPLGVDPAAAAPAAIEPSAATLVALEPVVAEPVPIEPAAPVAIESTALETVAVRTEAAETELTESESAAIPSSSGVAGSIDGGDATRERNMEVLSKTLPAPGAKPAGTGPRSSNFGAKSRTVPSVSGDKPAKRPGKK